ncbi:guanylate kinase [Aspergillus campestris IBT 28561]|uniref:guanylate kinase n=1 Tax=Aspergillus campestris (strain IBT 28561) TaxID=1392248 RepID=A0A2I1CZZ6_ASPC2|nr:guanylate kinase [Aspergillus campestris IBT 28561]PKY03198.1 guanylate kinase [Aspergillus campestris IBT 28561]
MFPSLRPRPTAARVLLNSGGRSNRPRCFRPTIFASSWFCTAKQHPASTSASAYTSPSIMTPPTDRRPIIISGPSGVGKGTLFNMLFEKHPDTYTLSISHTTRSPRPGEKHGVNYYYVTKDEFRDLIAQDKFVENAQFGDNFYGTSKMTIEEQTAKGKVVVLDIEMEGVKQVRNSSIGARYVFIAPPSEEELERRLRGRGTETEDSVLKRLAQAKKELEFGRQGGLIRLL